MDSNSVKFSDDLPAIPESLLLARDRDEVLFIVGAGASRPIPTNLPDFGGLVKTIYSKLDSTMVEPLNQVSAEESWTNLTPKQQAELKYYSQGDYDVVLGMLERRMDGERDKEGQLRKYVHEYFNPSKTNKANDDKPNPGQPNDNHKSLVTLAQRSAGTFLVTTNFDRLLHIASRNKRYKTKSYALGEIPQPTRKSDYAGIFHIHGMVGLNQKDNGSELILTDHDFGDAYLRRHEVTSFIYDAARIYHLVLVGYSADDAPMRYLLNAIAGDDLKFPDIKGRFAFIGFDPDGNDENVLKAEWEQRGITPIIYKNSDNHSLLTRLLSEWAESAHDSSRNKWEKRKLREVVKHQPGKITDEQKLLEYIFRRATQKEKNELATYLGKKGAHPEWLDVINSVIRAHADNG